MSSTDDELANLYGAVVMGQDLGPSWNVAPTEDVRVVMERIPRDEPDSDPQRQLRSARWGLVPSWAKDVKVGNRMINARVESITTKSSFKAAASRRRCVVPADGYYEWETGQDGKQPFFLHRPDELLHMAGLYELWPDPAKDSEDPSRWLWSVTIVTTNATDALGHIHDRSPLILPISMIDDWLDPTIVDLHRVDQMTAAVPDPVLQPYAVGRAVNSVKNNGPELLAPLPAEASHSQASVPLG